MAQPNHEQPPASPLGGMSDRHRHRVLTGVILVLTALAAVFAALASGDESRRVLWWVLGGVCLVLLVVPQRLEAAAGRRAGERNEERLVRLQAESIEATAANVEQLEAIRSEAKAAIDTEREARAELTVAVNTLFQDIASNLGEMLIRPAGERKARRADMITGCLNAASAARLLGCADVRANFYVVDEDGNLAPVASKGRPPAATNAFIKGTTAHTTAMRMLEDSGAIVSWDTSHDAPDGFAHSGHGYRTFVSVPVRTRERVFGMLTVDARRPGDLLAEHVELARTLGQFLAATLAAAPIEDDPL